MVHWRLLLLASSFALLFSACEANSQNQVVDTQKQASPPSQESALTGTTCTATPQRVEPAQSSMPSNRAPDLDKATLIAMGEQAAQIAQKVSMDVVLRQVDTDLSITDFRYVDGALSQEITVVVPGPDAPVDQWVTTVNSVSPLLTHAETALDLHRLKACPNRVAQTVKAHWPGCSVRSIILYLENDRPTWTAFCDTPQGVASGSMDDQTGEFQPSEAPPAPLPITATAAP